MLEAIVVCATDTTINLLHNRNYALWEDTEYRNGYMFSQSGEWQFYAIDEAQNRHVADWTAHPMEGIYELSKDTIWLFQRVENQWEKIRGLLILQASSNELTIKLLDKDDDWTPSWFDTHLEYLNNDTINIIDSEQWAQTWEPIYQKRPILIEYSFPICTLKNNKVKRQLKSFVEEAKSTALDTANIGIELYVEKRKKGVYLIANCISNFSGKDIWGVLYGTEIPIFILNSELNGRFFTKQSATIPYSICMEETKYKNGILSYDICDEYLYGLPIKSTCIPLR